MKHTFKYISILSAVLFWSLQSQAQVTENYHSENKISTSKNVSETQNSDGTYTLTLETFAEGETALVTTSTPVDVVLVLDVSGSMVQPKGTTTNVASGTNISYNDVKNGTVRYFYRDGDGDYDEIYCEESGGRYYLYYDYGQGKNYIYNGRYGTTTSTSRPSNTYAPNSPTGTVFTAGTTNGNATTVTAAISRIEALKEGVCAFIDEINTNDSELNGEPRVPVLGNRIGIVTYNNDDTVVRQLQAISGKAEDFKSAVNALVPSGGTRAGEGMERANVQLQNYSVADHNKVVVMFTDGLPTDNFAAITQANTTKGARGAIVYTVGLFTNKPATTSTAYQYLNAVSSNYGSDVTFSYSGSGSNAQLTSISGTGSMGGNYYKDASGNVDLTAIFVSISQGIGGSSETVGTTTQVRDVVSSSFALPIDTEEMTEAEINAWVAQNVKVYTSAIASDGESWGNLVPFSDAEITVNSTTKLVSVQGFDFSKADTPEGSNSGNGNWVGERYNKTTQQWFYAGKKLVIEFPISVNPNATGGVGTNTNTKDSGVYVLQNGQYVCLNHYEEPHTTLAVNLVIKKTGLRHGESATFQIMRIAPKRKSNGEIEYNALGKPEPNEHEFDDQGGELDPNHPMDYLEGKGWIDWSKVIVTNKGADGAAVVKSLVALDPNWVYRIIEDDWGWAYTTTGSGGAQTTSTVAVNPFEFVNTEKTNVPKHAEAVSINHFGYTIQGGDFDGKQVESYSSSKVESFTNPTNPTTP